MKTLLVLISLISSNVFADTEKCQNETIKWFGELNIHRVLGVIDKLNVCIANRKRPVILLNSEGGTVIEALVFFDYVRTNKLEDKFTIKAFGSVDSAGNIIFIAASERIGMPGSVFLWHETSIPNPKRDCKGKIIRSFDTSLRALAIDKSTAAFNLAVGKKAADLWRSHMEGKKDALVYPVEKMKKIGVVTRIDTYK